MGISSPMSILDHLTVLNILLTIEICMILHTASVARETDNMLNCLILAERQPVGIFCIDPGMHTTAIVLHLG